MSALPIYSYVVNVTTNIAICTIISPMAFNNNPTAPQPVTVQNSASAIDLASYYISVGSSGVGTIITFQELMLSSTANSPSWTPLVSPAPITGANSTNYNGILNGPFHGLRMLISSATGNGITYARLTGSIRML